LAGVALGLPCRGLLVRTRLGAGCRGMGSRSWRHPKGVMVRSPEGSAPPPLPGTHASVADCWQNSRCWHLLSKSNTVSATPSCRTRTPSSPAAADQGATNSESTTAAAVRTRPAKHSDPMPREESHPDGRRHQLPSFLVKFFEGLLKLAHLLVYPADQAGALFRSVGPTGRVLPES